MDRVRLGRALGYGARHAAKTLQAVAEAAAAPGPEAASGSSGASASSSGENGRPVEAARPRRVPDAKAVRSASRSMWGPLATFSGALWLRVTGLFFGLVACALFSGAWRARGAFLAGSNRTAVLHFWMFAGFGMLFGYFAVSGFVRASARERRGR